MNGLHRSRQHRIVAGVAGGLAESLHVPVWLIRVLFILALIPGGVPGLLIYGLLWLVLPEAPAVARR
jgi:phage shock protein PspC (stress-responsive transcriptional regulator)